jgi:hypothetical protein
MWSRFSCLWQAGHSQLYDQGSRLLHWACKELGCAATCTGWRWVYDKECGKVLGLWNSSLSGSGHTKSAALEWLLRLLRTRLHPSLWPEAGWKKS